MISETLNQVRQQIAQLAQQFSRSPDSVQLLAVSKTRPLADIRAAFEGGQHRFGENYLQEALPKIQALQSHPLEWHFIGPIQSNKTRAIAEHFDWVHSLDSLTHAQRLNAQRPPLLPPLNVCIQVNLSQEPQKAGIKLAQLPLFAQTISQLPRLRLRGLMTLPAFTEDFEQQRLPFRTLHQAWLELQHLGFTVDTLSMGMSGDLAAAIAEGSTMLRIGTAIFGERIPTAKNH